MRDVAEPVQTGIRLRRTDERLEEIEALAGLLDGRAGLPTLLGDLNRLAHRSWAPGRFVRRAITWDAADRGDRTWWPQGVTSSADAAAGGTALGCRVLVVSWYSKAEQGSRLSFLDLDSKHYRHVLLVEPTLEGGVPGIRPLQVHAGGIVWHGPYLHVAATGRGLMTCRIDDLLRVPDERPLESFGYRYLLPVRSAYRAETNEGHERFRYSFLSLDHTAASPALVAGEYGGPRQTQRLARFALDPTTLALVANEGASVPAVLHERGVPRTQGAVIVNGEWHLTTSHGPWTPGSLWTGQPGALRRHRWALPMGPEDLTWWPDIDELWTVTEHPHRRWVVALKRP